MSDNIFDNLRAAFREAVRNFRDELHRDEIPEVVDGLVAGMRQETVDAKARLKELEIGIGRARAEAAREAQEAETCRRRQSMAQKIGDAETARIAGEYAERHERRRHVLEQTASALEQELALRTSEYEEMLAKIREAEKSRDSLAASAGRRQARESVRAGNELFDELDRMAEQMDGGASTRRSGDDLLDQLNRELDAKVYDDELAGRDPGADLDDKLAELKRRMGRES